jgi:peptidyl-prolyl cis-trans isomerase A (cyclophilin A)
MMGRLKKAIAAGLTLMLGLTACTPKETIKGNMYEITAEPGDVFAVIRIVEYGDITVKLFPDIAPVGVNRFIELAQRGYYDGKTIHRVIEDFMFQGGSLNGDGTDGDVAKDEYFPVETSPYARHFYGALAFAKNQKGNYCQFYIVNNKTPVDINKIAEDISSQLSDENIYSKLSSEEKSFYENYVKELKALPDETKEKYLQQGGVFSLDGDYTVFGQTVDGFDVIDKISKVEVVKGNQMDDINGSPSKPLDLIIIESVKIIHIDEQNLSDYIS